MIRLTNLADYAVVLMCQFPADPDFRASAVGLSEQTKLPLPAVSKVLNQLSNAGFLNSHRGLKGGFTLAKTADDISVADIIEAVDGPISLTNCIEDEESDCSVENMCVMRPHWQLINQAVRGALDTIRLSEINMEASGPMLAARLEALSASALGTKATG